MEFLAFFFELFASYEETPDGSGVVAIDLQSFGEVLSGENEVVAFTDCVVAFCDFDVVLVVCGVCEEDFFPAEDCLEVVLGSHVHIGEDCPCL